MNTTSVCHGEDHLRFTAGWSAVVPSFVCLFVLWCHSQQPFLSAYEGHASRLAPRRRGHCHGHHARTSH